MSGDNIKVIVRCRPLNARETRENALNIIRMDESSAQVIVDPPEQEKSATQTKKVPRTFTFDAVYDQTSCNYGIFQASFKPLIDAVLEGFNSTIFAYGQTGAGKTWTMGGNKEEPGAIPNSFKHLFDAINSSSSNQNFLVIGSYLELYNEEIRDLIKNNTKLPLKEDKTRGIYIDGLSMHRVTTAAELSALMDKGFANRHVAATQMNDTSSRSHSIFMVRIECSEVIDNKEVIRVGKLNLVDLAGSERQSKTGATGETLVEGAKINLSLSALGLVISKLVEGATHIPYRDSKLTRLLQDSLGGNSKTLMCANISPASTNYDETMSTLRYADRAKQIKNKPRINEDPKDAQIRQLRDHIARLEAQLAEAQANGAKPMDVLRIGKNLMKAINGDELNLDGTLQSTIGAKHAEGNEGESDGESTEEEIVFVEDEASRKAADEFESKRRALAEAKQKRESELEQKEALNKEAIVTLTDLKSQLSAIKNSVFVVKQLEIKNKVLDKAQQKLTTRQEKHNALQQALQHKQNEHQTKTAEVLSAVEKLERFKADIAKTEAEINEVNQEIDDITEQHALSIEEERRELKEVDKRSALLDAIIQAFIPQCEVTKAEALAEYDEEAMKWVISPEKVDKEHQMLLKRVRHTQILYPSGSTKPIFFGKGRDNRGFLNFSQLSGNILELEPELPERMTVGEEMDGYQSYGMDEDETHDAQLQMFYSQIDTYE